MLSNNWRQLLSGRNFTAQNIPKWISEIYKKKLFAKIDVHVYKKSVCENEQQEVNLSCMRMSCLKLFMSRVERAVIYS